MSKSIKITLSEGKSEYDYTASRLFGDPLLPESWADRFDDTVIFFGQIRLSDIASMDIENRLSHSGYLYFFLDTATYPYTPWVEHYDGEVKLVFDGFNEIDPHFAHLTKAHLMTFSEVEEDFEGTKLFGIPSFEPDEERELLLQFDPLDNSTGFLSDVDGYAYFFFGDEDKLGRVSFVINRS